MRGVAIIGGASSLLVDCNISTVASEFGSLLAGADIPIITCGSKSGVIGSLLDAFADSSCPRFAVVLRGGEEKNLHDYAGFLTLVDAIHQRKNLIFSQSDVIVALPGGLSTHDEIISFLIDFKKSPKQIILFNADGFFDSFIRHLSVIEKLGFIKNNTLEKICALPDAKSVLEACRHSLKNSTA